MKRVAVCVVLMLGLHAVASAQQFTQWSAPVNMGPVVNSPYTDSCVTVSKNGLSMFFFSNRYAKDVNAAWHLYVSRRPSVDTPWGEPQEIVGFNEGYPASCPGLSPDEHRLFFASGRPGTCGGGDIWVSRRHDRTDDFGWQPPVNLGCEPNGPNSPQGENLPTVFEDETGTEVLYMGSGRPGLGGGDIWASRMRPDGTFGPATLVTELSTIYSDTGGLAVRRDGLEVIFGSNRPDPNRPGGTDLWAATRASTAHPWSAPVLLLILNSATFDGGRMSFSFDGRVLYFTSDRPGGYGSRDFYVATREKLRQ